VNRPGAIIIVLFALVLPVFSSQITPASADCFKTPDISLEKSDYSISAEAFDFQAALLTGVWIPTGNNDVLGVHPQFGGYVGAKRGCFEVGISGLLSFVNAPQRYSVEYEGVVYDTKHYFGLCLGVDLGYEILYFRKNGFLLSAGLGYDWFLAEYFESDEQYKYIGSFFLNSGAGYRRYIFESRYGAVYLEVQVKYKLLDYKNEGGTDLSGDAVTIGLNVGKIIY
jgi:hypothetical protein